MAYTWSDEEYRALSPAVQEARYLLEDWFRAMESGKVEARMPDPFYPAQIEVSVTDKVVQMIDAEFDRELRGWASSEAAGGYTIGPGFTRLKPPQRLALAQQLHALKLRHVAPRPASEATKDTVAESGPVSLPF